MYSPTATADENAPGVGTDPAQGQIVVIQPDSEEGSINDSDSAIGDTSNVDGSTTSLSSSIRNYRKENGRTYHSYKDGKWFIPNDEAENDRLDLQHHMYMLSFDGALGLCPMNLKETKVGRVLDVGTGTGIWAIDFADEHPESVVMGVDLSPTQPEFVPPNLTFEIDDLEETWVYSRKFDYIHSRMMTGALFLWYAQIHILQLATCASWLIPFSAGAMLSPGNYSGNWPRFFEQSFENLESGGWLETQDLSFPSMSDDNTLLPHHALFQWTKLMMEAAAKFGRPLDTPPSYKELLEKAGFVNVTATMIKWPQNRWPRERKYKELGMWCQENLVHGVEGICMALFTRALGWTREEVEVFLIKVREDMKDTSIHAYWPMWVVYAQKPLGS